MTGCDRAGSDVSFNVVGLGGSVGFRRLQNGATQRVASQAGVELAGDSSVQIASYPENYCSIYLINLNLTYSVIAYVVVVIHDRSVQRNSLILESQGANFNDLI